MTEESEIEYKCINPESGYDSSNFIEHYENFKDMNEWLQMLQKDPESIQVREKTGGLFHKNDLFYLQSGASPRLGLEKTLSNEYDALGNYAKNHSQSILSDFVPEDYVELIQKVPLYKTGNTEHDEFVDSLNKVRSLEEMRKDPNKMAGYVQKRVMDSNCADGLKLEFLANIYNEKYLQVTFQGHMEIANSKLDSKMYEGEGQEKKIKKEFLEKVFKDSLSVAEDAWNDENYSDSEKSDVWDANTKPYYFALIESSYKKEKADEELSPAKEDRNKRRKERREKGMQF